ncbi:unnamed protein product [Danaus chrysippus]|uniref:(African queen) hypothetical protein n=1 Tax=Danaus chrysippus TaxID=151541 RepID=A0A8J2QBE3_9NEOP|nr:unnamed protein product [Danaus chrysippus]
MSSKTIRGPPPDTAPPKKALTLGSNPQGPPSQAANPKSPSQEPTYGDASASEARRAPSGCKESLHSVGQTTVTTRTPEATKWLPPKEAKVSSQPDGPERRTGLRPAGLPSAMGGTTNSVEEVERIGIS